MAEPTFDRVRFTAALGTHRLGRTLVARAEVGSTNDLPTTIGANQELFIDFSELGVRIGLVGQDTTENVSDIVNALDTSTITTISANETAAALSSC